MMGSRRNREKVVATLIAKYFSIEQRAKRWEPKNIYI